MGNNVSKRQQPDKRVDTSQRPPMGLQYSQQISHPEKCIRFNIVDATDATQPTTENACQQDNNDTMIQH